MANGHVAKAQDPNSFMMIGQWIWVYAGHLGKVILKLVPVHLHNGMRTMDVFIVLDNILERLDPYTGVTDPQGHIQTWPDPAMSGAQLAKTLDSTYFVTMADLPVVWCNYSAGLVVKSRYLLALRLDQEITKICQWRYVSIDSLHIIFINSAIL